MIILCEKQVGIQNSVNGNLIFTEVGLNKCTGFNV